MFGIKQQLTVCSISCDFKHTKSYALFFVVVTFIAVKFIGGVGAAQQQQQCSLHRVCVFALDILGGCNFGSIGFQKRVSHVTTFRQVHVGASDYCCSLSLVLWCTVGACQ